MTAIWTYLNDRLVPADEVMVPITDRGFLYGDSLFETMAVYSGVVFRLNEHLERLMLGAATMGIPLPNHMDQRITSVLRKNGIADGLLRLTLSRGSGPRGLATGPCRSPTLAIQCFPCPPARTKLRQRGASLAIARRRRIPPACLPSNCKTGNYLNYILGYQDAEAVGADEALMLDLAGEIVEGTVSNLFFVAQGTLFTPPLDSGAMPGITRRCVLECAATNKIDYVEKRLPLDLLNMFDEAFYTSTGVGIMPIGRIGEKTYHAPGLLTARLVEALGQMNGQEAGPAWNAGPGLQATVSEP